MNIFFREFTVFHLDYNLSTLFEQVEYFNQWSESMSGKFDIQFNIMFFMILLFNINNINII